MVTFANSVVDTIHFGATDEQMIAFAEAMVARSGTDIFSAVMNCIDMFPSDTKSNNVLILMTDGQDNDPKSLQQVNSQIGTGARKLC